MNKPRKVSLGDLISLRRGYDLTKQEMQGGQIPVVGSNGIIGFHNVSNVSSPCLTVGRSGTVGIPHIYKTDCWAHNTCLYVKDFKGNEPDYIYYLLKVLKLEKMASSTGVPTLNRNFVHPLSVVAYSSRAIQRCIAQVLLLLDKKISLNDSINTSLEKIAKTLYDYWFVQFDFPDENKRPYKSSGGKMVYNEVLKREIPEGWTSASLNNICLMYQPQTIGTDQLLPNGKFYVYGANGIIGKYDQYNHVESEIAVACRGNSCGVVNRTLMKSWITGNAMVVQMKDKTIHNEYLYQMLKCINIKRIVTGSGQPQITRANLAPIQVSKPHQDLLLKYSALVASNVTERLRNELENQKLAELRDFLLPMLMNGQVSVKS